METLRPDTQWFVVDDVSASGSVRRAAIKTAETLGFDAARAGEVGIVASEIASNVVRHGSGGAVGLQIVRRRDQPGVQIIALDNGPGMDSVFVSSRDGHSTGGTLGVGLGAITRLSTTLDVSSEPGRGTVLVAELWVQPTDDTRSVDIGGITRPMTGEEVCGDSVAGKSADGFDILMACDGLGHGPMAADASSQAVDAFHTSTSIDPAQIIAELHARLRGTRGAAVAVAAIDHAYRKVRFAGVGNISAILDVDGGRRSMSSFPGIVGHRIERIRSLDFDIDDDTVLVMHSDGVRDRWNFTDAPALRRRTASVISASILRDWGDRPDDASVVVVRRR